MLVSNLPPEAVTSQLEDPDGASRWTQDTELMAEVVDNLRMWRWEYAAGQTPRGKSPGPRPDPFPRPEGVARHG